MNLSKALFTAGMYFKNGELYELGNRLVSQDELANTVRKQRNIMHDYYISPGTPKMMSQENRYLDAVEAIQEFLILKPQLEKLGINYESSLKEQ